MAERAPAERKRRGAWYTPAALVRRVLDGAFDDVFVDRLAARTARTRVLDPACGDGRFLAAVHVRLNALGIDAELTGVEIDSEASAVAARAVPGATIHAADARDPDQWWDGCPYDVVIGNPPFLSQLSEQTTRGGASPWGGGPYADVAAEFLALGAHVVADDGRVAFVLPQSLLAARDAAPIRERIDARAELVWSWWSQDLVFDAAVHTCAIVLEFPSGGPDRGEPDHSRPDPHRWAAIAAEGVGLPTLPAMRSNRTLGDRAWLNANFRDEYYGLVPAVGDHATGPPLVTSGLIDPGCSRWGERTVRFAKQSFDAPRVDLTALDDPMRSWAGRRLVPKVLVANQTRIIEAVADVEGSWLPAVPVVGVYPFDESDVWPIAALLTSPIASLWAWYRQAGTGRSADTVRLGPRVLADLPWPADGDALERAAGALRRGDVRECGRLADRAWGVDDDAITCWWTDALDRIDARVT